MKLSQAPSLKLAIRWCLARLSMRRGLRSVRAEADFNVTLIVK